MTASPPPLPPEREQGGAICPGCLSLREQNNTAYRDLGEAADRHRVEVLGLKADRDNWRAAAMDKIGRVKGAVPVSRERAGLLTIGDEQWIVPTEVVAHATALARQLQEAEAENLALARRVEAAEQSLKLVATADQDERPLPGEEGPFDWRRRSMKQEDIARAARSAPAAGEGVGRGE